MGNAMPDACVSCFSRAARRPRTVQREDPGYCPPSLEVVSHSPFFPLKESFTERIVDDGNAQFDLQAISQVLDKATERFFAELEVNPQQDPTLELLLSAGEFQVYGKETPRGLLLRTDWQVPYPPQTYVDFIRDFSKRKEWDKNIDECRKVCYLSAEVSINYQRYKKVMIVAARELLVACRSVRKDEGWVDVSCSVTSPAFPISENFVRAHLHVGGYRILPVGEGTRIEAISEMDFGGSIPRAAMKRISAVGLLMFTKSLSAALAQAAGGS